MLSEWVIAWTNQNLCLAHTTWWFPRDARMSMPLKINECISSAKKKNHRNRLMAPLSHSFVSHITNIHTIMLFKASTGQAYRTHATITHKPTHGVCAPLTFPPRTAYNRDLTVFLFLSLNARARERKKMTPETQAMMSQIQRAINTTTIYHLTKHRMNDPTLSHIFEFE